MKFVVIVVWFGFRCQVLAEALGFIARRALTRRKPNPDETPTVR